MRLGVRRLSRLRASPHEIALGCAAGAFASITPLLGVQTLLAVALAVLLRASIPAAVVGTFVGNPLSWPFIWASTYAMGLQIIGLEGMLDPVAFERSVLHLWAALIERSPQVLDATAALLWPLLLADAGRQPADRTAHRRDRLLYFQERRPCVAGPSCDRDIGRGGLMPVSPIFAHPANAFPMAVLACRTCTRAPISASA